MGEPRPSPLQFAPLITAAGWEAYLVQAPPPPAEGDAMDVLRALAAGLRLIAERGWQLTGHTYLQLWKLAVPGNSLLYEENLQRWQPSVGLGVFPHRAPPQRMTADMAMDHAAALMTGEEPERSAYHLAHVSGGSEAGQHAERELLGRGMVLELFARDPLQTLLQSSRKAFLPSISDSAYRSFPFYLPLLDARTVGAARADDLEQWMGGAELYLRESAEDGGLLLVSRKPLRPILDRAAEMMAEADGKRRAASLAEVAPSSTPSGGYSM